MLQYILIDRSYISGLIIKRCLQDTGPISGYGLNEQQWSIMSTVDEFLTKSQILILKVNGENFSIAQNKSFYESRLEPDWLDRYVVAIPVTKNDDIYEFRMHASSKDKANEEYIKFIWPFMDAIIECLTIDKQADKLAVSGILKKTDQNPVTCKMCFKNLDIYYNKNNAQKEILKSVPDLEKVVEIIFDYFYITEKQNHHIVMIGKSDIISHS